jgi:hypothetical protein
LKANQKLAVALVAGVRAIPQCQSRVFVRRRVFSADLRFPVGIDVRETAQEVRIELGADVIVDFENADIRSHAAATLPEAAHRALWMLHRFRRP